MYACLIIYKNGDNAKLSCAKIHSLTTQCGKKNIEDSVIKISTNDRE